MSDPTDKSDVTAASSSASVDPSDFLASLSGADRDTFYSTGDLPDKKDATADSSPADTTIPGSDPAKPVEQAAATAAKTSADSEPAKPAEKRNAETRLRELLSERAREREEMARLRGRLEALERGPATQDAKPGSSPDAKSTQAEYERYLAMPDAPKEEDFDSYAKFTAAVSVFIADQRWQEHSTRANEHATFDRQVASVRSVGEKAATRIAEAMKADPTFRDKVDDRLLSVQPASVRRLAGEKVGPQHVLAEQLLSSDHTDKLLMHFSTEAGQKEWAALCALPPAHLLRAFGRVEARFDTASPAPAPALKTVTDAPDPPPTVGRKPAGDPDEEASAIARGDVAAYMRVVNARELAAQR